MALNWDNVATTTKKNTGLNWDKVNTSMANQQAFNIMNQAIQQGKARSYNDVTSQPTTQMLTHAGVAQQAHDTIAKQKNEVAKTQPIVGNTQLPNKIQSQETNNITGFRPTSEQSQYIKKVQALGDEDNKDYLNDYLNIMTGRSNQSKYTKNNYTADDYIKYYQDLVNARPELNKKSFWDKAGDKINDVNDFILNKMGGNTALSFVTGMGEGSGGSALTKFTMRKIEENVARADAMEEFKNGEIDFSEIDKRKNEILDDLKQGLPDVQYNLNDAYEKMGNHQTARGFGNTAGYVTAGTVATSLGVPAPIAYGTLGAANKYAETDDLGDIAVAGGTNAAFGWLTDKFGGAANKYLSKIPITKTNVVANALKNFGSGYVGAGGASLATGTAEDLYNVARGREVNYLDTLKQANRSGLVHGTIRGVADTINDVKQAKAQMQADYKNTAEEVENMRNIVERSDAKNQSQKVKDAVARKYEPRINEAIEKFEDTKYLGQGKTQANLVEQLKQGNTTPVQVQNTLNTLALPEQAGNTQNSLENTQNALYNQTRGDLNGKEGINTDGRIQFEKGALESKKTGNGKLRGEDVEKQFQQFIQKSEPVKTTPYQDKVKDIVANTFNKSLNFVNDDGGFGGGVNPIDNNDLYITSDSIRQFGNNIPAGHEVFESIIKGDSNIKEDIINPLIELVQNDNRFGQVMDEYLEYVAPEYREVLKSHPENIAKEIICDELGFSFNEDKYDLGFEKENLTGITRYLDYLDNSTKQNVNIALDNIVNEYVKNSNNQSSFSLAESQPQEGYTRLYRGLSQKYNPNYDKSLMDNSNGYESWTDNYDLAKSYGDNVYYTDIPTNQISNSVIDENPNSETYGDRNLIYKNDKPVGINGKSGNEYMLYTDHDNYPNVKYNEVVDNSQPSNIFEETNKMIQDNRAKAVEEGAKTLGLEKANENLSTYKKQMFQNNANAINDLIKAKSETLAEFDNKIAIKKQELAGKKDQTTKVAQTLRQQITNLEKRKTDAEASFINKIDRLENRNATINKLKTQVSEDRLPTRQEVKNKIITDKDIESINLDNAKNLSKFIMNNTTPQRVNEKIFGKDTATKINDRFFKPIKHNEAERIRFLNKERKDIKSWRIKPKSRESAAVQMYGEGEYVNPETGEKSAYTLNDLKREFPNDWEKIKNASEQARAKYDTYIDEINKELNKMGYDSIPKRNDYFRHFEQTASLLDTFGIPSKANALPTDMNGLTADLRPGKNFFANALQRKGDKTTYDAITGIDGYLEGASKLRYHTEDIQNLRTLDDYIRGKYGSKADLEGLSKEDFNKRVKQIQEGHLSEYASWLTEYTNSLAGKKSRLDRGTEEAFGRSVYGTLNALKKQVGSNLTGLNINSALSNFISAGQGLSSTSKVATVQGLVDTIKNIFKNDDFIDKSDFLTTRFGSDKLSKTLWEKASDVGQTFMSATDYFTANLITRSKYHEYLNKGYPEQEALEKAGEYADRIMAGRGLGDMPNFFNSKTLGILTQFQLENVNQFDSMFHDNFTTDRASEQTKYDAKTWNEKIKSKFAKASPKFYNGLSATFTLAQLFAAGWAFNKIVKELGGTGGAFDPIGTIEDLVKDYQKDGLETATKNFVKNVVDDIPYANLITGGGRIPMKDSLPNLYDLLTGESTVGKELTKLANVLPPTGGGQVRKTIQGLKTLINNGEYGTRNGNEYAKWLLDLDKKDVPQKIITSLKALAFGKYGPEEAKEYIDSGYKGLTVTQTNAFKEIKDTGMLASEFRKWVDVLDDINPKKVDKYGKEKVDANAKKAQLKTALDSPSLSDEQKKILYEMFYKITE